MKNLLQQIINLSLPELNELIHLIEQHYNIPSNTENNTNNSINSKNEGGNLSVEKENIQKEIEIIIESILPDKKISVLKVVKNLLNLGLKETKEILDNLPKQIKTTKSKDEAEEYKKQLELSGAIVKFK